MVADSRHPGDDLNRRPVRLQLAGEGERAPNLRRHDEPQAEPDALRKDMFQTTVVPFLEKADDMEASVLRLELLASNFRLPWI
jgi:hypothetical protein